MEGENLVGVDSFIWMAAFTRTYEGLGPTWDARRRQCAMPLLPFNDGFVDKVEVGPEFRS